MRASQKVSKGGTPTAGGNRGPHDTPTHTRVRRHSVLYAHLALIVVVDATLPKRSHQRVRAVRHRGGAAGGGAFPATPP